MLRVNKLLPTSLGICLKSVLYVSLTLGSCSVAATENGLGWSLDGLAETLIAAGNAERSWLDEGTGKFRQGADEREPISRLALSARYHHSLQTQLHVELAYHSDAQPRVGVTQAYWQFKPIASEHWRTRYRVGAFHLPTSFENHDLLWGTPYSITSSVTNTWIGEEFRAIGAEGRWQWQPTPYSDHQFAVSAAAFAANDSAGAMLAWRGWAAHDRQTFLGERIDFADIPVIANGQPFSEQAAEFEPFVEVDNRVGYYLALDWRYRSNLRIRHFYYDNRGDPLIVRDGQYAWATKFHQTALRYHFSPTLVLISQYLFGTTEMGPGLVDLKFDSGFAMLSKRFSAHRLTLRAEFFAVEDNDLLPILDPNDEHGNRLTLAYAYHNSPRWSFDLEASRIRSDRDYREVFQQETNISENKVTARVRYRFD